MKCWYPYQKITKMGWAQEYPCGRCLNCRINRAEEWTTRIKLELEDKTKVGDFVTLTFDDKKTCPLLPILLSKRILQNYFKRLRKAGNKIKYFAAGEYGEKLRAHYHLIVIRGEDQPSYEKHWGQGNVVIGTVTSASARYVTGYLTKSNAIPKGKEKWPPFQLQSQGMGEQWAKNKRNNLGELKWKPRYLISKAQWLPKPEDQIQENPGTRIFTTMATLNQRRLNALAKQNNIEN